MVEHGQGRTSSEIAEEMATKVGGDKKDAGKLRYDLLPVEPLREVVVVLTKGAEKYTPDGWKKVPGWRERYTAAALRHIEAWRGGERRDPEMGTHHLANAACCLFFLMWFELTEIA